MHYCGQRSELLGRDSQALSSVITFDLVTFIIPSDGHTITKSLLQKKRQEYLIIFKYSPYKKNSLKRTTL